MTTLTIDPSQQETQQTQQQATQAAQTTTVPTPGTPEYDQVMAQKGAALREQFEDQRPEWLPEKFWQDGKPDYASLAQSYAELEKKLGSGTQQQATQQTTQQADPTGTVDFSKYEQEFVQTGALSDASHAELIAKGIPKTMVDTYVAGQKALVEKSTNDLLSTVGGADNFGAMKTWAATALSESELSTFNSQVIAGTESAKMALQWLAAKHQAAQGSAPRLLSGAASSGNGAGFRSMTEVTTAMKDPRYNTDPAYRADVMTRFANKQF